ncbi:MULTISPECIES: DUF485 domain-containing protein [unclassified Campylobacter]|uniref:DUF485 domain-containing protein n=1 Tax=unclassified Campylobacter TaxID=2593542 RepID=UPI001238072B|nr:MULTISPECIES: DUF485 domain-containing protein [unclassified Campylobacter]KAA6226051.1 DUF485 domain-containing protein [Campylobacter sp. LR196d]KAA6226644.1 DUF485 domain-containing protein [Campylobacter sp. LR286c]KAA6230014.1 DUF485 domain-containing protein [Campylobacter sp. LR291e]KAA6230857.1 DUF485 domain-containing protein [Campylobacter sp. LR264d]
MQKNKRLALSRLSNFVSFRNTFALWLSAIVLICYYGFMIGVGFFPEILGYHLGPSSITLGIIVGLFIIILVIALTGIYTLFANKYLDKEQEECIEQLKENDLLKDLQEGKIHFKDYQ